MKKNFKKKSSVVFVFAILLCFIFSSCELSYNAKNKKEEKGTLRVISVGCDFHYNAVQDGGKIYKRISYQGKNYTVPSLAPATVNDAFHVGKAFSAISGRAGMKCENYYLLGTKNLALQNLYPNDYSSVGSLDTDFETLFGLLNRIKTEASNNDITVLYLSTHGNDWDETHPKIDYGSDSALKNNVVILAPTESQYAEMKKYSEIFDVVSSVPGTKIIIADCCFSGSFATDNWVTINPGINTSISPMKILFSSNKITAKSDVYCIAAATYQEESFQSRQKTGDNVHGCFTKALLQALGWNDDSRSLSSSIPAQKGKKITLSGLFNTANKNLPSALRSYGYSENAQHAVFGEASADIVLFQF